jgi:ABC-type cobalamin/Fe3+-siderophores transport system ATPase subunit
VLGLAAVPVAGFIGAVLTVGLVYSLSRAGGSTPVTTLILAGVAVSSFATAGTSLILLLSTTELHRAITWMVGGFSLGGWEPVLAAVPYLLLGLGVLVLLGRPINVLQFGDEQARQLGLDVERLKLVIVIAASLVAATAVSFSGIIAFVGLIVPHLTQLLWGPDYRRLLPPLSGQVRINGQDLRSLRPAARARLVSVVPQATDLPGSFLALDVVLMGRTPYLRWLENEGALDREAAQLAMERTELAELAERPVGELSGGEQQRVLIARALAQQAPVMLLDEPTAHLDLRHQDQVLRLVRELARERSLAVLLALHDLNLVARFADRVALLSDGGVRALGKPEEVLTPDGLADVYGMRIHVMPHPVFGTPLVLSGE